LSLAKEETTKAQAEARDFKLKYDQMCTQAAAQKGNASKGSNTFLNASPTAASRPSVVTVQPPSPVAKSQSQPQPQPQPQAQALAPPKPLVDDTTDFDAPTRIRHPTLERPSSSRKTRQGSKIIPSFNNTPKSGQQEEESTGITTATMTAEQKQFEAQRAAAAAAAAKDAGGTCQWSLVGCVFAVLMEDDIVLKPVLPIFLWAQCRLFLVQAHGYLLHVLLLGKFHTEAHSPALFDREERS